MKKNKDNINNKKNLKNNRVEKNNKKVILINIAIIICIAIFAIIVYMNNSNVEETLSKQGSQGNEVTQIQTKLKRWGYYSGEIDGIYGSKTVEAVKYFQRTNGLTADGIAGTKTLQAMGIYSTTTSNNSTDLNLLSRIIYAEARGEPYSGQVAVGAVCLNRVKNSSFPNTLSGVIYQAGAFDAVSDGQINLSPDATAKKAAQDALNGWDPSYGAIYYFNPDTATSKWIWSRPLTVVIGKHRFCK